MWPGWRGMIPAGWRASEAERTPSLRSPPAVIADGPLRPIGAANRLVITQFASSVQEAGDIGDRLRGFHFAERQVMWDPHDAHVCRALERLRQFEPRAILDPGVRTHFAELLRV